MQCVVVCLVGVLLVDAVICCDGVFLYIDDCGVPVTWFVYGYDDVIEVENVFRCPSFDVVIGGGSACAISSGVG